MVAKGVDIINMGVGDPDRPTPGHIVQAMHEAIDDPATHNYPPYQGTKISEKQQLSGWNVGLGSRN
jgi:LL-diaminopimelate aminotransferase